MTGRIAIARSRIHWNSTASTVSIRASGQVFLNETPVAFATLSPALRQAAGESYAKPIYVRADGRAPYALVAQVMASLAAAGFSTIDLITDTGGPSSGAAARTSEKDAGAAPGAP